MEVEDDLSTMATLFCRRGVDEQVVKRTAEDMEEADVQTRKQVRGFAGTAMCETRDLGFKVAAVAHFVV